MSRGRIGVAVLALFIFAIISFFFSLVVLRFDLIVTVDIAEPEEMELFNSCSPESVEALDGAEVLVKSSDGSEIAVGQIDSIKGQGGMMGRNAFCQGQVKFEGIRKRSEYVVSVTLPSGTSLGERWVRESRVPWGPKFIGATYCLNRDDLDRIESAGFQQKFGLTSQDTCLGYRPNADAML